MPSRVEHGENRKPEDNSNMVCGQDSSVASVAFSSGLFLFLTNQIPVTLFVRPPGAYILPDEVMEFDVLIQNDG